MRECLTCFCGSQTWTVFGGEARCNACGWEAKLHFTCVYAERNEWVVDVAYTNKCNERVGRERKRSAGS